MFCKIVLSLLLLSCTVSTQSSSPLQSLWPAEMSAVRVADGVYAGEMEVTMSKGKTFKGRRATFMLRQDHLLCDFPKIGKMPGKIKIDLLVHKTPDGRLTAPSGEEAGVMKMPMGLRFKLRLESFSEARITDSLLVFRLQVYGQLMGARFPVRIDFRGDTCK